MTAVLFGSISSLADTSELQRAAFNEAFAAHGLDWTWSQSDYAEMLQGNGGADRVADYARSKGEEVDAQAVHQAKSELFRKNVATAGITARPGVLDVVRGAKEAGIKVGLVTTTTPENVQALVSALGPDLTIEDFAVVVDLTDVEQPKPDKAAYAFALEQLGEQASDCVAIEDNVGGVKAALAAGLPVVAFPNENTSGHDFAAATTTVDHLELDALRALA